VRGIDARVVSVQDL